MSVETRLKGWTAAVHARYPRARWIVGTLVAGQFVWRLWNAGGDVIDAYSHAQFMAAHQQEVIVFVKSAIGAIFSPVGSLITFVFGIGYLVLDSRTARLAATTGTQPSKPSSPQEIAPPSSPSLPSSLKFKRVIGPAPWGIMSDLWADIENDWQEAEASYRTLVQAWNSFFEESIELAKKTAVGGDLNTLEVEGPARTALIEGVIPLLKRFGVRYEPSTTILASRVQSLNRHLDLFARARQKAETAHTGISATDVPISAPSSRADAIGRIFADITPQDLVRPFDTYVAIQAEKLIQPYLGKWLRVTEPVGNVRSLPNGQWQVTVALKINESGIMVLSLTFDNEWGDRLSILTRDATIRAIGQIDKIRSREIFFEHCELITP
jgi:hypothetical protein